MNFPRLEVYMGFIGLEIICEPYLVNSIRGYAPVVDVKHINERIEYSLYISAKSISDHLEPLRAKNNNMFTGIKFKIKKEDNKKISKYIIEEL